MRGAAFRGIAVKRERAKRVSSCPVIGGLGYAPNRLLFCLNDVRELHETEFRQEFGASELRLESFCQKPLGLQTKLGIAVKRERARRVSSCPVIASKDLFL